MKVFDSFWKPSFYKDNEKGLFFWPGLVRILFINIIISIVYAVVFYVYIGKNIPTYFTSFSDQIKNEYPPNLILSIKDGVLVKNVPGEIKLYSIPNFYKDGMGRDQDIPKFALAIDDSKEVSLSAFAESEAFVFLGKDGWIAKGENEMKVNSYKEILGTKDVFTFSTGTIDYIVGAVDPHINKVAPVVSIGIIILYIIFVTIGYLFFVLYLGLVVMLLSKYVLKNNFDYPKSYIYSLYAFPSIVIVEKILVLIPYVSNIVSYIPFFTTILVIVFLWYMLKEKKESH